MRGCAVSKKRGSVQSIRIEPLWGRCSTLSADVFFLDGIEIARLLAQKTTRDPVG